MKNFRFYKILFLCWLLIPLSVQLAQVEIPTLKNYANDFTNTFDSSELYTFESKLKSFDDSTSNQVVFLIINSLDGYPLESFCYETATKNKIGSKKNNNGILFFVAKGDRKMRIEVGYGLEGVLPDALASSILRNEVRPYFKQGDYYAGVNAGLNAILSATKGEYKGEPKGGDDEKGFPFIFIIILIFILVSVFGRGGKGGRGGGSGILPWLIISSMGGRSSGSWGSSGGFGSGGFGGFSGGGGSFGGGGSSGSW